MVSILSEVRSTQFRGRSAANGVIYINVESISKNRGNAISSLRKKLAIYFIGFTAALAGLLFGLDIGVISGALPFVKNAFNLSIEAEGTVVSALLCGAVIGTLVSGMLSSNLGRRKAILVSAVIFRHWFDPLLDCTVGVSVNRRAPVSWYSRGRSVIYGA